MALFRAAADEVPEIKPEQVSSLASGFVLMAAATWFLCWAVSLVLEPLKELRVVSLKFNLVCGAAGVARLTISKEEAIAASIFKFKSPGFSLKKLSRHFEGFQGLLETLIKRKKTPRPRIR